MMSNVSRIFVVESEEDLNRNIVNSLRKDGYMVQGVMSGVDALRILWAEEYDVVICDLKTPGADGFELLQWLRAYRPHTRMIIIGGPDNAGAETQALEGGAASYLEKPLEMRRLREELRSLLQQTGFSASLDSFDLLDVIQIINMSRKNIALLVSTGLEERGLLRFQNGELVWAEYGGLRGEEAFFALAAHKNGTVVHQPWNGQVVSNVTLPLSRLIFQALQYRTKYAHMQQHSGEQAPVAAFSLEDDGDDDRPFVVLPESPVLHTQNDSMQIAAKLDPAMPGGKENGGAAKEWWEITGQIPAIGNDSGTGQSMVANSDASPTLALDGVALRNSISGMGAITPSTVHKTPASQRADLPSWLTDQPTASELPAVRPSSLTDSTRLPVTPVPRAPSSPEWQTPRAFKATEQIAPAPTTGPQKPPPTDTGVRRAATPAWQTPEQAALPRPTSGTLPPVPRTSEPLTLDEFQESVPGLTAESIKLPRVAKRNYNYSALVAALQTLGYSITGFVAAAVVALDGQPIAQVAVDDLDISRICKYFSHTLKGGLQSLDQGSWGTYQDTVITSSERRILMRLVGSEGTAFQVLITTREADPVESLEVMTNVEGAISAALRP
jgi:DNA-binding response OmpR family regulator/predicted regulator of Ras-like GTPase activity (Roadblock/LC7/MglB family)